MCTRHADAIQADSTCISRCLVWMAFVPGNLTNEDRLPTTSAFAEVLNEPDEDMLYVEFSLYGLGISLRLVVE